MKTLEQKAKAYDNVRDKIAIRFGSNVADEIFSEYEESEDERIRKELLEHCKNQAKPYIQTGNKCPQIQSWIAWLEKQGEQKAWTEEDKNMLKWITGYLENKMLNTPISEERTACKNAIVWLKNWKIEQKPVDKVEPKFKEGDWIICCNYEPVQIISIRTNAYEMSNGDIRPFWMVDNNDNIRLWTIEDAKDGDVLASEDKDKIFIYNGKLDLRGRVCAYCGIYKTHDGLRFTECAIGNYFTYKEPYPATKEQRDTLMKAMADAGYTFDFEKKELKKIVDEEQIKKNLQDNSFRRMFEQKLAWSEENEEIIKNIIAALNKLSENILSYKPLYQKEINWLKSLKDRVHPKQEWSEEDESRDYKDLIGELQSLLFEWSNKKDNMGTCINRHLQKIVSSIKSLRFQNWTKKDKERYISCLQRLSTGNPEQPETINSKWFKEHVYPQNRWKPSDEQMKALWNVYQGGKEQAELATLYNDLKKLKEE